MQQPSHLSPVGPDVGVEVEKGALFAMCRAASFGGPRPLDEPTHPGPAVPAKQNTSDVLSLHI